MVWSCEGNLIHKEATTPSPNYLKFEEIFKIYPNPSKGKFTVEISEPAQNIHIISIDGQLIQTIPTESNQTQIEVDLTGVAKGIYMVQLQNDHSIKTKKMIVH